MSKSLRQELIDEYRHTFRGPSAEALEEVAATPVARPVMGYTPPVSVDWWRVAFLLLSVALFGIMVAGTLFSLERSASARVFPPGAEILMPPAPAPSGVATLADGPTVISSIPLDQTPRGYALPNWAWGGRVEASSRLCSMAPRWGAKNAPDVCR
jgi:hypothetical protein